MAPVALAFAVLITVAAGRQAPRPARGRRHGPRVVPGRPLAAGRVRRDRQDRRPRSTSPTCGRSGRGGRGRLGARRRRGCWPSRPTTRPCTTTPRGRAASARRSTNWSRFRGFRPGPDTDTLTGDSRGGAEVPPALHRGGPAAGGRAVGRGAQGARRRGQPAPASRCPGLHLLDPAWASPVVYRESSVLLRDARGRPADRPAGLPGGRGDRGGHGRPPARASTRPATASSRPTA